MSLKLKVPRYFDLSWPKKCIVCGKQTDSIGSIEGAYDVKGLYRVITVGIKYSKMEIRYPICTRHKIQAMAVRFVYFLTAAISIIFGIGSVGSLLIDKIDFSQFVICIISLFIFILVSRAQPIRLKNIKWDNYTIILRNEEYAREFSLLNKI